MRAVSPRLLFRTVAVVEACTWALLLVGMFLKYVTETTELLVSIGGMLHGVAFIAYCLTTLVVAHDQRWTVRRTLVGLLAAVPPFVTVWFDVATERAGLLREQWRLRGAGAGAAGAPAYRFDGAVGWLVRKPLQGLVAGVVAVAVLTGVALAVGPPVGG